MRAYAAIVTAALAGCTDTASPDLGLESLLRVDGAQYRPGAFPAPSGGPDALAIRTTRITLEIGSVRERVTGALGLGSRSAVLGVDGIEGAWLVAAGSPTFESPDVPSVAATIALADEFPPGPFTLMIAGGDADGRFGARVAMPMIAAPELPPDGELVIELVWDGAADLDLHVVDPLGGEAWSDDPNTLMTPPPGTPVDPEAYKAGGILDRDGNADCHRDARPRERVIWSLPPPTGEYIVRVDTRSMCGGATAAWYVAAYRGETLLGAARGVANEADVQQPHGAGAGVLALRFSL